MQFRQLIEDWMEDSNESYQSSQSSCKITKEELNTLKELVRFLSSIL